MDLSKSRSRINTPTFAWNGRGHFFAAAAEAMRRILIEIALHGNSFKEEAVSAQRRHPDAGNLRSLELVIEASEHCPFAHEKHTRLGC